MVLCGGLVSDLSCKRATLEVSDVYSSHLVDVLPVLIQAAVQLCLLLDDRLRACWRVGLADIDRRLCP